MAAAVRVGDGDAVVGRVAISMGAVAGTSPGERTTTTQAQPGPLAPRQGDRQRRCRRSLARRL